MNTDIKNAVIYTRTSCESQTESQNPNLSMQFLHCMEYAKKHNLNVVKQFNDHGVSGLFANRKGFNDLLDFAGNSDNRVNKLIIFSVDRLARDFKVSLDLQQKLNSLGVEIVSAGEDPDITPTEGFIKTILAACAQYDNQVKSERIKRCMKAAKERKRLAMASA